MKPLICLTNASLVINNKLILDNINLSIEKNITAITGHNGAGKTSLLKILSKIYVLTKGSIMYANNIDKNKTSYLFQDSIFLNRTIQENLLHYMKVNNYDRKYSIRKIKLLMEEFNIFHLINSHPLEISSGERQIISFIRGLLIDPEIYFLDEPFNNLDNNYTEILYSKIRELSYNIKIVFISHSDNDIVALCPEVIELYNGTIINV